MKSNRIEEAAPSVAVAPHGGDVGERGIVDTSIGTPERTDAGERRQTSEIGKLTTQINARVTNMGRAPGQPGYQLINQLWNALKGSTPISEVGANFSQIFIEFVGGEKGLYKTDQTLQECIAQLLEGTTEASETKKPTNDPYDRDTEGKFAGEEDSAKTAEQIASDKKTAAAAEEIADMASYKPDTKMSQFLAEMSQALLEAEDAVIPTPEVKCKWLKNELHGDTFTPPVMTAIMLAIREKLGLKDILNSVLEGIQEDINTHLDYPAKQYEIQFVIESINNRSMNETGELVLSPVDINKAEPPASMIKREKEEAVNSLIEAIRVRISRDLPSVVSDPERMDEVIKFLEEYKNTLPEDKDSGTEGSEPTPEDKGDAKQQVQKHIADLEALNDNKGLSDEGAKYMVNMLAHYIPEENIQLNRAEKKLIDSIILPLYKSNKEEKTRDFNVDTAAGKLGVDGGLPSVLDAIPIVQLPKSEKIKNLIAAQLKQWVLNKYKNAFVVDNPEIYIGSVVPSDEVPAESESTQTCLGKFTSILKDSLESKTK